MYSDHFMGVHEQTAISYEARFPATSGPGGEWVAHWKTTQPHPGIDLPGVSTDNTFVFATPQRRAAWWKVVRKNIIWMRMLTENGSPCMPDRNWLDLTDDLATQEGSAA